MKLTALAVALILLTFGAVAGGSAGTQLIQHRIDQLDAIQ